MDMNNASQQESLCPQPDVTISTAVEVSVVVPVFNEVDNVESLWHEISAAMTKADRSFEVIFVDDASTDGSADRLMGPAAAGGWRVLKHRLNCGQSAAIATGFRHARGALVATLDGDGQNDPGDLPRLLDALFATGADCVTGIRAVRRDSLLRRISSRVANGFRNWMTGDCVTDSGCGIRVVRRACLAETPVFNGMHRFLPTLLRAQGFRVEELAVNHRPRVRGVSKYGVHDRLWRGLRDCLGVRWYLRRAVPGVRLQENERGA
jgi:dolichol-phosphate mannosyltransferase